MSEGNSGDLLFEYLRSILYDANVQPLDLDALDEEHQKLGKGLQYLEYAVKELKAYTGALSVGDLSACYPSKDNPLCDNLKNIQANLNHLTWQAKQVAKGDYTQTVSYLGEFSKAFNTMTAQLREREAALKKEAQREKEHADLMEREAHQDSLTGISNRYDLDFRLEKLLHSGENFSFCFCDLDNLKKINDTFGHTEGDKYLCSFVRTIQSRLRATDIFSRVGGDEFCIILRGCPQELAQRDMASAQLDFLKDSPDTYQQHFSFGIVYVAKAQEGLTYSDLLRQADVIMYQQKRQYKESLQQEKLPPSGEQLSVLQ